MKGMQKIKRGTGFKGVLQYALEGGRGVVIGGNLSADAPPLMQREFLAARALRPDIEKAVWHNSLRLTVDEKIDAEKWARICDSYMSRMGFSELHQRTYILHDDAEGQHIHIIANRIALDGKVYLGQNENLESTRIIADLERTYDLTITKGRDYESDGQKKSPTKSEVEMAIRTGEAPPKMRIQAAIDAALEDGGAELPQFIERVESAGITVALNLASTGRISGISFECDEVAFKGSSLGKNYSYANLEKRGLTYDIEQHRETAQTHSQNRGLYNEQVSNSERNEYVERNRDDIEYQSAASADTETRTSARTIGAEHRTTRASAGGAERRDARADIEAGNRSGETDSREQSGARREREVNASVISKNAKDMAKYSERRTYDYSQDVDSMRSNSIYHNGGSYSRIADLFKSAADSRTGGIRDISSHSRDTAAAAKRQAIALGVKEVLIGIRDSINGMMMHKTYLVEKFEKAIPWLKRMNARGNDIYIRPGEADTGILLVDDLNKANLDKLQKDIGTVAVTETSPGNFQAWCRLADTLDIDTRREASRVIAERYGADMNSADGQHYGRLAGFTNRKPQHSKNGMSPFVIEHKPAPGRALERAQVLESARQRIAAAEIERAAQLRRDDIARTDTVYRADPAHLYRRAAKAAFDKYGESADVSKVDYYAAKMLAIDGYSAKTIAQTIIDCSPDIEQRKAGHVADYAARTVDAACKDPAVLRAQRKEQKRSYGMAR